MKRQESAKTRVNKKQISPFRSKEVPWKLTAAGEVPASEAQTRQAEMSISVFPAEP